MWFNLLPKDDAVPIPHQGRSREGCLNQGKEVLAEKYLKFPFALRIRWKIEINKYTIIASCDVL